MFNRAIQVKMIKSNKEEPLQADRSDVLFEAKAATIALYFNKAVDKIGKAAITYVVLDTFRQVLVAKASRKI